MKEQNRPELAIFKFVTRPLFAISFAIVFVMINGYLVNLKINDSTSNEEMGLPIAAEYFQHNINPYELTEIPLP
jgi:hypothetical protein